MSFVEAFRSALRALRANKFRSALTMLGVIIGVSSVILLVSIGAGLRDQMTGQIRDMGSNLLFVFPGKMDGMSNNPAKRFTMEDYEFLKNRLPDAEAVVAIIQAQASAKAGNHSVRTLISAANHPDRSAFKIDVAQGRCYRQSEVDSAARVAFIGSKVATQLFPNQDPVGKTLTVNGQRFQVVGVQTEQGGGMGGDSDNIVAMPVTTAMKVLGTRELTMMAVKVADSKELDSTSAKIRMAMKPRFGDEISAYSQKDTVGVLNTLLGTLTMALAGIAGISLVVGGIGIMNIMLVSVSERTREIGIRKAVGAKTRDVLGQFMIEAVVLSVLGGSIGIAVGASLASALNAVTPTTVEPWAAISAFLFSAGIGVFFGVYPASKASRLDPIVALRRD